MTERQLDDVARRALATRFPARDHATPLWPTTTPTTINWVKVALAAAGAVLTVIAVVVLAALWPRSSDHAETAAGGASSALPDMTRTRVMQLVDQFEHALGGGKVAQVEVVQSTHSRAVRVTMGDGVEGNQPVLVIQLQAATAFHVVHSGPPGATTNSTAKYEIVVVDARSFSETDASLGNQHVDLSTLGPVTRFRP